MNGMGICATAIGGLVCLAVATAAAQDAPKVDDKRITQLISKLGDQDFDACKQAQSDLIAIGAPAREAVGSGDPEVAHRATMVLLGIDRAGFDAASKKAQDNILWTFPMKAGMVGSPRIKDGTAYVADAQRVIHAVDLKTGKEKWSQGKLPGDKQ